MFPRVTEILADVGLGLDVSRIPSGVLEAGRARGAAVHAAIEAIVYGYDGEATIPSEIAPYLDAYRKFVAESGYETIATEIEVVNTRWRYRGHPDSVGWLGGARIIPDWKTGDDTGSEYQLAGYRAAWNAEHPTELVTGIAVVNLRDNGTYRFTEISADEAEPIFLAAVIVFWAKRSRDAA